MCTQSLMLLASMLILVVIAIPAVAGDVNPPKGEAVAKDDKAPGWDAIDAAMKEIYGKQEPKHYAAPVPAGLGGGAPLNGISAYAVETPPHWHFVTYGFTELYDKENEDPKVSGFGFELTFRLARSPEEKEPPVWALNFLQNLARYVFKTRNPFGPNHKMSLNGPIAMGHKTAIVAISFVVDPQLKPVNSVNGAFKFLQVVGLTDDEHTLASEWDGAKLADEMKTDNPLLVTDLSRASILADPRRQEAIAKRAETDGSTQDSMYVAVGSFTKTETGYSIKLGALGVRQALRVMMRRLPYGRPFLLATPKAYFEFKPGPRVDIKPGAAEGMLQLELSGEAVKALQNGLKPVRGTYRFPEIPGVEFIIEPTEIKTPDGKIVETIG